MSHEPIDQVANAIADDVRAARDARRPLRIIAWITADGSLFCSTCIVPTDHQREHWVGIATGAKGKVDACDICGLPVWGAQP